MKRTLYASLFVLVCLLLATDAFSQTPTMPSVPTTKILAISRPIAPAVREKLGPMMQAEVTATVKLYLAGKMDQWYFQTGKTGVVFILNVTTIEEARALLESLPLGQAKIMEFDYTAIGPLAPLGRLIAPRPAAEVH